MTILAIDLGKFKSVACVYGGETDHAFRSVATSPQALHDLITQLAPARVVFEVGPAAGWLRDLCEALGVQTQVADPRHEAWRWKSVKRKTDRDDALKLARLSAMGQLPTVTLPVGPVRQWRSLIGYRQTLVARQTAIKNHIRSILERQGLAMPKGKSGWTHQTLATLALEARPLAEADAAELWRGELHTELEALGQAHAMIERVEQKLATLAKADKRVALLQTIPGVGPRLAETVVAILDDPARFKSRREVGAYAGLVPRQFESGTMSRQGKITGRGNKLLRALLVEVSWLTRQHNPRLRAIFEGVCRGSKTRRRIAVTATARRLLVICWAMLRDGTPWREEAATAGG